MGCIQSYFSVDLCVVSAKQEVETHPVVDSCMKAGIFICSFVPCRAHLFFCEVDDDLSEHATSFGLSNPGTSAVLSASEGAAGLFFSWHV